MENNTVTVTGKDDSGNLVQGSDQASVNVIGSTPSISARKTADPNIIEGIDETITFTFTVTNTSALDQVTIEDLDDSKFGDLDGQGDCSVPQVLKVGESYTCTFETKLDGSNGMVHVNQLVATGSADDGSPVAASDMAVVLFLAAEGIPNLGRWGVGLMVLLLGWLGLIRIRSQ